MQTFKQAATFNRDYAESTASKKAPVLSMPATTLIQNLYAQSPEEQDVAIAEALAKEESFPAETPIRETAGKKIGLMWPRTFSTTHPAAPLPDEYANRGCPVDCGPDWSHEHIEAALL